eukprot:TRINITY_DN6582_c0_g1_i1.p1 TRINITY_DN6582_c0_g1~~TRINITY_DN6582_c0_g1_i1.p1  ORF type:complete len:64 (-),score=0.44 TRINITY_DN6582_c0_g1_i1:282-473(-)
MHMNTLPHRSYNSDCSNIYIDRIKNRLASSVTSKRPSLVKRIICTGVDLVSKKRKHCSMKDSK